MKEGRKEKRFIDMPEYPGGKKAFREFIHKHLQYPAAALENKIEGRVFVRFRVDGNGHVVFSEVTHGIGYGCDEEALRLVNLLKYGKAKNRGLRVTATIRTQIAFKLPVQTGISYSYTKKVKEEPPQPKPTANTGYGYTISF
ncbi:MAG: energy transducer TonB [Clostridia bacterium]|nr:energy transducer TonB [Clostridia bacterium]